MPGYTITLKAPSDLGVGDVLSVATRHGMVVVSVQPSDTAVPALASAIQTLGDEAKWAKLLVSLTKGQRDILTSIKEHPQGQTSKEMGKDLNREISSITGSLGPGLRSNIPNAGFAYEDVIITKTGKNVPTVYFPGPILSRFTVK